MEHLLERYITDAVLHLIVNDVIFAKKFKEFVPQDVAEKVDSYRQNTNCTCKTVIIRYCMDNRASTITFVKNFIKENPQISLNFLQEIENNYKTIPVGGKIFRIPKNDEAFENFFKYSKEEKFQFRSFSVTDAGTNWLIFFL